MCQRKNKHVAWSCNITQHVGRNDWNWTSCPAEDRCLTQLRELDRSVVFGWRNYNSCPTNKLSTQHQSLACEAYALWITNSSQTASPIQHISKWRNCHLDRSIHSGTAASKNRKPKTICTSACKPKAKQSILLWWSRQHAQSEPKGPIYWSRVILNTHPWYPHKARQS